MNFEFNNNDVRTSATYPKRRKARKPTYVMHTEVSETGEIRYFASFIDGEGVRQCTEVNKDVYDFLLQCESEDRSYENEVDRHIEQLELTEAQINMRAVHPAETVEEAFHRREQARILYKALASLPKGQYRRFFYYHLSDTTYGQLAVSENCSIMTVKRTIDRAKDRIKNYFLKKGVKKRL